VQPPRIIHRPVALLLACAVLVSNCATAGGRISPPTEPTIATPAIVEFVQRLPPGSAVQVDRRQGRSVRGTLLKATADLVIVQPRTRLPEPPVEIAMADIVRVQPESTSRSSLGKAIGIGAAAGASAALGVFFILLAIFSD
jgi:hypothetical protein